MTRAYRWMGLAGAGAVLLFLGRWQETDVPSAPPSPPDGVQAAPGSPGRSTAAMRPASLSRDSKRRIIEGYGRLPISFEPNAGQASPDIRYLARGRGYGLYLTDTGATIGVASGEPGRNALVRMHFEGALPSVRVEGKNRQAGHSNYFLGDNPAHWRTNVPHFARVAYSGIYPGIDLVYYGNQNELEYDIVVAKGADPNQVRLRFDGVTELRLDDGDLILVTRHGELKQRKPVIYQEVGGKNVEVAGRYVIHGRDRVSFEVAKYDRGLDLVIDPVLAYSSYLGGSNTDFANAIAVDAGGSAYIAGGTDSTNFPGFTPQSFVRAGFVTKLAPSGASIVYTTFIGGSGTNWAKAIAVDASGNAFVTGLTTSTDFPVVAGFQSAAGGGRDGFVAKLNPDGDELVYSSYIGGSGDEFGAGIAVDSSSNAYVTGTTVSANFPLAAAIQGTYAGHGDAFLSKVNAAGTALVYSTYIGGSFGESGERVAVDASGAAYVTGGTSSTNFPTVSPIQAAIAGGLDAFVTKVNPAGSAFAYSTYLGGAAPDSGLDIAVDSSGAAFISGYTYSTNFPTQAPVQAANGGVVDAFVAKLNAAGSALLYSTYLGGSGEDFGYGIAVDSTGHAVVTGMSASANFPTVGGVNAELGTGREAFVSKYNPTGSALVLSFRYGGNSSDEAADVAVDANSSAYVTGSTASSNFPVTSAPAQPQTGGAYDVFVSKIGTCDFNFDGATPGVPFQAQGGGGSWSVFVGTASGCPWVASSAVPWVTVSSGGSGNGNGTVQFNIQPNTGTDTREGSVTIAGTTFVIQQGGGPSLSTTSSGLIFYAYAGNSIAPQTLQFSYSGSSAPFSATAQPGSSGGNWLVVAPTAGTITGGTASLNVSINTSGLNFNQSTQYQGTILITSSGAANSLSVPVTVYTSPSYVYTDPEVVAFAYRISGSAPEPRTVTVFSGSPVLNYTLSSSASFVQVSPSSGSTSGYTGEFQVSVDTTSLGVGIHNAVITITPSSGFPYALPVKVVVDSSNAVAVEAEHLYFTFEVGTDPLLSQQVPVRASSGEIFYFASSEVFDEVPNWITVSPSSGVAPGTSQIGVNASNLSPGFYEGVVYYNYDGLNPDQPVFVHLTVSGSLSASPDSLHFEYQTGGTAPAAQAVFGILDTYEGSVFMEASAGTASGGSWLMVSPSSGSGNSVEFLVSVNHTSLSPGTYQGSITISAPDSGLDPVIVPVTFTVSRPALIANPGTISRTYSIGQGASGGTVTQAVAISTGGGNVGFSTSSSGGSWLSVSPSSGSTPANLTVTMNPNGLSPGTYNGSVTVSSASASGPLTIPVTFVVEGLSATPSALTLGSFAGASGPVSQIISLGSLQTTQNLTVTSTVNTPSGGTWLSASPSSGNGAGVFVSANPNGLPVGTYTGSVTITPADFPNSAITVPVTYIVSPLPSLTVPSGPVTFSATAGAANVPVQTVTVSSSGAHLDFRLAPATVTGGSWLSAYAVRNATTPADVMIAVNAASLAPGSYSGSVVLSSPNDSTGTKTIPVALTVTAGFNIQVNPSQLTFATAPGVNPAAQTLTIAGEAGSSFTAFANTGQANGSQWLSVSPQSGTFSTGTTPLTVSVATGSLVPGTYTGSIVIASPGAGNSPVTVPVTLTVASSLMTTAACPAPVGFINQPYSLAVGASGGTPGYTWSLFSGPLPPGLILNPETGIISGSPTGAGNFPIVVRVTDSGGQTASYSCTLSIAPPVNVTAPCPAPVAGLNSPYTFPVTATGGFGNLSWELIEGPLPPGLVLNPANGVISGSATAAGTYPITVRISDSAPQPQRAVYQCAIVVASAPVITATCPAAGAVQGRPYSFPVSATGGQAPLRWQLTGGSLPPGLTLNESTGLISGTPTGTGSFAISVTVSDALNQTATYNCNIIVAPALAVTAPCPGPTAVQGLSYAFTVSATGGSGPLTWAVTGGALPAGLTLNPQTGVISGAPSVSGSFPVTITVTDSGLGNAAQTAIYECAITVNAPLTVTALCPATPGVQGSAYTFAVTATGGQSPLTWQLSDSVLPPGLTLNTATGVISGTPTASGTFPIVVRVTDSGSNGQQQTATYQCAIVIGTQLTITASCPATPAVQGSPYSFTVSAVGGQAPLTWQLNDGALPPGLTLNTSTGVISGTPTANGTYPVTIRVTDSASNGTQQSAFYNCNIVVGAQLAIAAPCPATVAIQGSPYSFAVAATGGQGPLTWQTIETPLPPGLTLNTSAGVISGTPTVAGSYPIVVRVTDSGSNGSQQTATYTCDIIVRAQIALTALCPATPAIQGSAYSFAITATGGQSPLTWQLIDSTLPPGLTLNTSTGVISGTPTASGTYPITVRIADSGGNGSQQTVTYSCNIVVGAQLTITAACPATPAVQGLAYTFTVAATGGQSPLTWQLLNSTLPPGLTLNASTGVISGTPTANGTYPINVRVTDSGSNGLQQTATYTCNIVVGAPLTITAPCPATPAIQGSAYSFAITATGGQSPLTWQLNDSTLPPGLTLNTSTGVISGTPTAAGTFPVTVRVTDSGSNGLQQTATYTCNIVVTAQLTISAPCPATGAVQGQAYSFTVAASGGQGALTWQLTSGPLPAGLTLNTATGAISGTPTAAGTFPITVRVTDSATGEQQQSATYTCNIVVTPTLAITAGCPANTGVQGSPFSFTVSATGGAAPLTWQLLNSTLPPGLTLNASTGAITGTPTAAGTYPINVRITDSGAGNLQQTATYTCNIVINSGLTVTTACPIASAVEGQPYSLALAAAGGASPYTWQLPQGSSLPAGLTLNAATGIISGTPTVAGTFPITVQVRDTASSEIYAGQTATFTCNLVVVPSLKIGSTCPAARGAVGVPYSFSLGVTGGTPPYTYAFSGQLPQGLTFNAATGVLSGTPTLFGTFDVSITVSDAGAGGLKQTQTFTCAIVIATAKLEITSACPASPQRIGTFFSHNLAASGGDGQYQWTIAVGALPEGVGLFGSQIRGTPIGPPGNVQFTLQVSSEDQSATQLCSIAITNPAIQITSGCPGNGTIGTPFTPFPLAAAGGAGPGTYTFSIVSGSLPAGLTLTNGVISGTPQGPPGTANFSIQAASGGQTVTRECAITISALPLTLTGTCPQFGTIGTPISIPVTASGGQPPYAFTFTGSQFLSFNNGVVSGTPVQGGNAQFSVSVTDASNGPAQIFSCNFPVAAALAIGATCPQPARAGTPVNIPLTATGGTPPYTWSVSAPSWLTLSATTGDAVSLSGTPQTVGFFDFTVTLTDSAGAAPAVFTCTLTVNPSLQISTAAGCPVGPIAFQSPVALSFGATGGAPPFQWSLSGPAFLTLGAATGESTTVTGAANVPGTFTATVSLRDSSQGPAVQSSCTFVVNPAVIPPITIGGPTAPGAPLTQVPVSINLGSASPVPLRGTVRLTFIPNSRNPIDNPQVHFSAPCLRECPFVVAAGSQTIPLPNVELGTVAGTVRIEIVELFEGDRNVLSPPAPLREIVIPASRPVITSVALEERTDGFDIVISGYSPTREISSFTLTFAARANSTIQGDSSVTRDITALFDEFYRSQRSVAGGSMFEGLRIPISIGGDKEAIGSVTVVLTNSVGGSDPVTRTR